ncbi:MAG: DNA-processing protein DprA [Planctomycetota bacterium]|nr:DNA-processing protein DprA [Planctomycetota bacterium]
MHTLKPGADGWPPELDHIEPHPKKLWLRGHPELLARRPRVAIVGSRAPTPYGEAQARRFGLALAEAGVVVVSGLARGIDGRAHEAALDAKGATIAVLGCGVDRPWPPGPLADRVASEGLLLSEYEPGTTPRKGHFPMRNRLISALADAVVVVEAAHASGSLITAHWAAEQGRAVFALPGRVDHPMARGCHRLIREGVELVEAPEEVLRAIAQPGLPFGLPTERGSDSTDELELLLVGETLTVDEMAASLGRDPSAVLPRLTELELAGRLVRSPGGLWRLAQGGA